MRKEVNVNLGCGPDGLEGWVNIDWGWLPILSKLPLLRTFLIKIKLLNSNYDKHWPKIVLHDLRLGIPLESNSVDWIYNSNFIEHLDKYQVKKLLIDSWRVLKKTGQLRLVVPDLKKVVANYIKNKDADVFCREFYGFDKDKITGLIKIAIRGHQWMYDERSLLDLLKDVGFKNIKISSYRRSQMPGVDKLDLECHRQLGLYIEACKT